MSEKKETVFVGFKTTPTLLAQAKQAAATQGYTTLSEFVRAKVRDGLQVGV